MANDNKNKDSQTGTVIMLICMLLVGIAALFLIAFEGNALPNLNPNTGADKSSSVVRTTKAVENVKADSQETKAVQSVQNSQTQAENVVKSNSSGKEKVNDELTYIKAGYDSDTVWGDFMSIYFDYTNNQKENKVCGYVYDVKVFQNGGQLDTTLLQTTEESRAYYNEVLPGSTVRVAQHLQAPVDKTSPITVQVTKMFSKKVIWQKEIQINNL